MRTSTLHYLFGIVIAVFCLSAIPQQSQAANKGVNKGFQQAEKERLVLMPLRVPDEDKNLTGAMETALVKGLQQKYDVYSGEQVSQKAHEIFMKESRNTAHKECDETKCMQNIAMAFQAELIATANVTKQDGIYFLALSIQNIFDNKVVDSESLPCKNCDAAQVIDKLKELVGISSQEATDSAVERAAAAGKIKLQQLQQAQTDREQAMRNADADERKRLQAAKVRDDEEIAKLKAEADTRKNSHAVQNRKDYPTIQSAADEIKQLNDRISNIEVGYQKEVDRIRSQISHRYDLQLDTLNKETAGEFEKPQEFNARQQERRNELKRQHDNEKIPTVTDLASGETEPIRKFIHDLQETEYVLGAESLVATIGQYDSISQKFPIHIHSNIPSVNLDLDASIPLPIENAKLYKPQWQAGLVRIEATVKPGGSPFSMALVNDVDNSRLSFANGAFMSVSDREKFDHDEAERKAAAQRSWAEQQAKQNQKLGTDKTRNVTSYTLLWAGIATGASGNLPVSLVCFVASYFLATDQARDDFFKDMRNH
jgi:hypothetical protein